MYFNILFYYFLGSVFKMAESKKKAESKQKKVITDIDVKRKATKLVVAHLKKKISRDFIGSENINEWIAEMEELLEKPEFEMAEYFAMRKRLNELIERVLDEEIRFKLRDSWYSLGKALDKKVKVN